MHSLFILNINANSKKIIGKPRFLSRGFIYFKNSQSLLKEIQMCIFDSHRNWLLSSKDIKKLDNKELKTQLEKDLAKLIYKKTEREPIVLVDGEDVERMTMMTRAPRIPYC